MSKHKSKHRYPDHTPRHRAPSKLAEFTRRRPRLTYGTLAGLLLSSVVAGGAHAMQQAKHESYPVTEDTCHILSFTDTGKTHEQRMPDGTTVTVDKVVIVPFLELTPQTEERFKEEGGEPDVHARQTLPGGTEIGQVQGHYESGMTGHDEVVLEPPTATREGALMEFDVDGVSCVDGLVLENGQWRFAGPVDQYESRLQQGRQSAP